MPTHKAWVDAAYVRRYAIAMRYAFEGGMSYSLTWDKGRRVGKDWLRGHILTPHAQGILPPLVTLRIHESLLPESSEVFPRVLRTLCVFRFWLFSLEN